MFDKGSSSNHQLCCIVSNWKPHSMSTTLLIGCCDTACGEIPLTKIGDGYPILLNSSLSSEDASLTCFISHLRQSVMQMTNNTGSPKFGTNLVGVTLFGVNLWQMCVEYSSAAKNPHVPFEFKPQRRYTVVDGGRPRCSFCPSRDLHNRSQYNLHENSVTDTPVSRDQLGRHGRLVQDRRYVHAQVNASSSRSYHHASHA